MWGHLWTFRRMTRTLFPSRSKSTSAIPLYLIPGDLSFDLNFLLHHFHVIMAPSVNIPDAMKNMTLLPPPPVCSFTVELLIASHGITGGETRCCESKILWRPYDGCGFDMSSYCPCTMCGSYVHEDTDFTQMDDRRL
jgi:hypothetical protein